MASTSNPQRLHWLPCSISHDGPAPVSEYFKPTATGTTSGDLVVEEATLRGRRLLGATYPLPESYAAYVLPKDHKSNSEERTAAAAEASTSGATAAAETTTTEELLGLGPATSWSSSASSQPPSSSLTYWKLDEHPTPQDAQRRALDWVGTAQAVAGRVSREEVERAMMKE